MDSPQNVFKMPGSVPQDLLLIHDIVGSDAPPPATNALQHSEEEPTNRGPDISSSNSDSDMDSEDEVEQGLLAQSAMNTSSGASGVSSDDGSSSSDSDSESEKEQEENQDPTLTPADQKSTKKRPHPASFNDLEADDDDETGGPSAPSNTYFPTKNEILPDTSDANILVPDIDEVDPSELLEKVGEVVSVVGQTVIVKGTPSASASTSASTGTMTGRAQERALDVESLLVFDDRKVLGYIYETFGPTVQPMYQIRFTAAHPLDPTRVRVAREVFHLPSRSRFIFPSQLRLFKGSDASNVHDEEPAEDELEFSDDEKEAEHRRRLKRARSSSRAGSVAYSRHGSPTGSTISSLSTTYAQMRDQDLAEVQGGGGGDGESFYGVSPYDAHGPYDDHPVPSPGPDPGSSSITVNAGGAAWSNASAGSSSAGSRGGRAAPLPYDDPYQDPPPLPPAAAAGEDANAISEAGASSRSFTDSAAARRPPRGRSISPADDRRGGGAYNGPSHGGRDRGRDRGRGRGRGRGGSYGHGSGSGYGQHRGRGRGRGRGGSGGQHQQSRPSLSSGSGYGNVGGYDYGGLGQSSPSSSMAMDYGASLPPASPVVSPTVAGVGAASGDAQAYSPFMPSIANGQQQPPQTNQSFGYGQQHQPYAQQNWQQHQYQQHYSDSVGVGMGMSMAPSWSGGQQSAHGGAGAAGVQPHINPRFASMFGFVQPGSPMGMGPNMGMGMGMGMVGGPNLSSPGQPQPQSPFSGAPRPSRGRGRGRGRGAGMGMGIGAGAAMGTGAYMSSDQYAVGGDGTGSMGDASSSSIPPT